MPSWEVVVYGVWPNDEDVEAPCSNRVMARWCIEDQIESEAFREAAADVQTLGHEVADWTMKEIR